MLTLFRICSFTVGISILFGQPPRSPAGPDDEEEGLFRVESYLNQDEVYIGDPVTYYLLVTVPREAKEKVGISQEGDWEVEVGPTATAGQPVEAGEAVTLERWFVLKSFKTGSFTLPTYKVSYEVAPGEEETMESSPLILRVTSLLDPSRADQDPPPAGRIPLENDPFRRRRNPPDRAYDLGSDQAFPAEGKGPPHPPSPAGPRNRL
jgi:hypothetical protein